MSRLRVVHVGAGLWGRSWAQLIAGASGYALAGVVDAGAPAREWVEAELGVPAFRDLSRALRSLEPDVVVLATPPLTHRPLAEQAFAHGSHVIVEKPLAPTLGDAAAIVVAAASADRQAVVSQNYRFRRQSRALRDLVRTRSLGHLLGARISCRRDLRQAWVSRRDWRGRMPHPYLFDMAIHHVDMLRMITGIEIASVDARSWAVPDGPFAHDPNVHALLELVDGTPVAYEGTWAEPLTQTSWNGDWELLGSRGRATWSGGVGDAMRGVVRCSRHGAPVDVVSLPMLAALDRRGVLAELRRALATGDEAECSAADNLKSLAVIVALGRSVDERRPVAVAEVAG